MIRVLLVILVIIAIGYVWYQWQARKAAEKERQEQRQVAARAEPMRSLPPVADAPVAPPIPAARPVAAAPAAQPSASVAAEPTREGGRLQDAADVAAGIGLDQQTEQMEDLTAGLAAARREADAAAARLAVEADEALAEVQAAGLVDAADAAESGAGGSVTEIIDAETTLIGDRARRQDIVARAIAAADADSVPPGAIRGDGGYICPPVYPIKGNASSMLYHVPTNPSYAQTIPELCFTTVDAATTAGYREATH